MEDARLPENQKALEEALQRKGERLRYDKENMVFNLASGLGGLLFTPDGAFTLHLLQTTGYVDLFFLSEGRETTHVG